MLSLETELNPFVLEVPSGALWHFVRRAWQPSADQERRARSTISFRLMSDRGRRINHGQVHGEDSPTTVPGLEDVSCAIGLTIASVDLVVVRIISFELLYGWVVLQHGRRRLVRVGVMLLRGDKIQPSSLFASALQYSAWLTILTYEIARITKTKACTMQTIVPRA